MDVFTEFGESTPSGGTHFNASLQCRCKAGTSVRPSQTPLAVADTFCQALYNHLEMVTWMASACEDWVMAGSAPVCCAAVPQQFKENEGILVGRT